MLVKHQGLAALLRKKLSAVYILFGQDHYLLNDAAFSIKKAWHQQGESDDKIIQITTTADWGLLSEEANSYSLFADHVLLEIRFEKKTIDQSGKEALNQYIQNVNPRCLIILLAPNVPQKQWLWLTNHEQVALVQVSPLTHSALQSWISAQLQQRAIRVAPQVPALIHQYTQGNMLASAQVIEKLALIYDKETVLAVETIKEHLVDQCAFQLYELADACLTAQLEKAIHILRQAYEQRNEPSLILWILTQEVRLLIQLAYAAQQQEPFSSTCSKLKIWPQRAKSYEATLKRLSLTHLHALLRYCQTLDELIKSNQSNLIWHGFEKIARSLACNKWSC